jgi:hypothetical protein
MRFQLTWLAGSAVPPRRRGVLPAAAGGRDPEARRGQDGVAQRPAAQGGGTARTGPRPRLHALADRGGAVGLCQVIHSWIYLLSRRPLFRHYDPAPQRKAYTSL